MSELLREVALKFSKRQQELVEYLTEETPILDKLKFVPASQDIKHVAATVKDIKGLKRRKLNGSYENVSVSRELEEYTVDYFGGTFPVLQDTAKVLGGQDKYFAEREPSILRQAGMDTEKSLLYDHLRNWCLSGKEYTNVYNAGGTTDDAQYSIIALRPEEGACQGIYNSKISSGGGLVDIQWVSGGDLMEWEDPENPGKLLYGYKVKYDTSFSYQISSPKNVALIANVSAEAFSTEEKIKAIKMKIDDALIDIKKRQNTMLLMHPRVKSLLGTFYKEDKMRFGVENKNYSTVLDYWDNVPIIESDNFLDGTEGVLVGGK